jgi:hypothetical protein
MANGEYDTLSAAFVNLGRACGECVKALSDYFSKFSVCVAEMWQIYNLPDSKVKHLAMHAKKKRVRKKNYKRLLKTKEGMQQ